MALVNLNNRHFQLLSNADHGVVSAQTSFHYQHEGNLVTAKYDGGGVKAGRIIATFRSDDLLEMRYQCILDDETLKAGKAFAKVKLNKAGLIELHLNWEWLGAGEGEKGQSVYVEVGLRSFDLLRQGYDG